MPYRPDLPLSSPQIDAHFDMSPNLAYVPNERQRFSSAVERRLLEASHVFRHSFHGITVRGRPACAPAWATPNAGLVAAAGRWMAALAHQVTAVPVYISMESTRTMAKHAWWYYICIENNLASLASVKLHSRYARRRRTTLARQLNLRPSPPRCPNRRPYARNWAISEDAHGHHLRHVYGMGVVGRSPTIAAGP